LHRVFPYAPFLSFVAPCMKQGLKRAVAGSPVMGYAYVIKHGKLVKKPDVLESPCNTQSCDTVGRFADDLRTVKRNTPFGGAINAGYYIEHRGFACSVGADYSKQFTAP